MRRLPLTPLALAVAVIAVLIVAFNGSGNPEGREVSAVVTEATNVIKGQEVRDAAGPVGRVAAVEPLDGGRRARVTLRIEDDRAWPLRRGAKLTVRFGGTAAFFNRHVRLEPGPERAAAFAEGAELPKGMLKTPVEFDQLAGTFDAATRRDLKSFLNRSGVALAKSPQGLAGSLERAPGVLREADTLLRAVGSDSRRLDTLVRSTTRVVDAVDRANPGVGRLVEGAATTFDAVADRQDGVRTTLAQLPGAMAQIRTTLVTVKRVLGDVAGLTRKLDPGVDQLRAITKPLDHALATIEDIAPDAKATLATARTSGDDVTGFLARLTADAPQLTSLLKQADDQLGCVRPYTPEIVNLLTTWGDWMSTTDGKDRLLRATVQNYLPASFNSVPYNAETAKKAFPGLRYGFPRPPGYLAGQPWYLPECGAGEDAVDPSKDKENSSFDSRMKLTAPPTRGGNGR